MKTLKQFFLAFIAILTFTSCGNDDTPSIVVEEEVITTLRATLTPNAGTTSIILESRDADGDGPNAPVISVSGNLLANTVYSGSIEVLNEIANEDITEEIKEKDQEHQFFFIASNNIAVFSYNDKDANGKPVGLLFTLETGDAGNGEITITLVHEPAKEANGVSDGDITNAGGEEDITVTFPIIVE